MIEITSGLILVDRYEVVEELKDWDRVLNLKQKFTIAERFKSKGIYIRFMGKDPMEESMWLIYRATMQQYANYVMFRAFEHNSTLKFLQKQNNGQH